MNRRRSWSIALVLITLLSITSCSSETPSSSDNGNASSTMPASQAGEGRATAPKSASSISVKSGQKIEDAVAMANRGSQRFIVLITKTGNCEPCKELEDGLEKVWNDAGRTLPFFVLDNSENKTEELKPADLAARLHIGKFQERVKVAPWAAVLETLQDGSDNKVLAEANGAQPQQEFISAVQKLEEAVKSGPPADTVSQAGNEKGQPGIDDKRASEIEDRMSALGQELVQAKEQLNSQNVKLTELENRLKTINPQGTGSGVILAMGLFLILTFLIGVGALFVGIYAQKLPREVLAEQFGQLKNELEKREEEHLATENDRKNSIDVQLQVLKEGVEENKKSLSESVTALESSIKDVSDKIGLPTGNNDTNAEEKSPEGQHVFEIPDELKEELQAGIKENISEQIKSDLLQSLQQSYDACFNDRFNENFKEKFSPSFNEEFSRAFEEKFVPTFDARFNERILETKQSLERLPIEIEKLMHERLDGIGVNVNNTAQSVAALANWIINMKVTAAANDNAMEESERDAVLLSLKDSGEKLRRNAGLVSPLVIEMRSLLDSIKNNPALPEDIIVKFQELYRDIGKSDQQLIKVNQQLSSLQEDSFAKRRDNFNARVGILNLEFKNGGMPVSAYVKGLYQLYKEYFINEEQGHNATTRWKQDEAGLPEQSPAIEEHLMDWFSAFSQLHTQLRNSQESNIKVDEAVLAAMDKVQMAAQDVLRELDIQPENIQIGKTIFDRDLHDFLHSRESNYPLRTIIKVEKSGFRRISDGLPLRRPKVIVAGRA